LPGETVNMLMQLRYTNCARPTIAYVYETQRLDKLQPKFIFGLCGLGGVLVTWVEWVTQKFAMRDKFEPCRGSASAVVALAHHWSNSDG
jgi:hypothetical protein